MLKRLLSFGIVLGFACSILLPNSFVYAEAEGEGNATTEEETDTEVDEEEADDAAEDDEKEETVATSDGEEDWGIYFYVIGFVLILTLGMYAFTEGLKKSK